MKGWILVLLLFAISAAAVAGAAWYRRSARPGLARELENEETRGFAFRKLLSLNGLFGVAREGFHDASAEAPGIPYLKCSGPRGQEWHVIRGKVQGASGPEANGAYVFTGDGDLAHFVAAGAPLAIHRDDRGVLGGLLAPEPGNETQASLWVLGTTLERKLSVRGSFGISTAGGGVVSLVKTPKSAPAEEPAAIFRYDSTSGCFRGPEGGADKPWQVDPKLSPGYCQ